ncbi:helix-turn-helix domain-containing protein [Saccharopolyspora phatthalungensis]|uniref:Transcriptional regulator with XRE-family HTH domain n=1 Tax=Saccharopolyspora phatthalungensis TaxID=664693 RepID=A0A840Q3T8_9PSEU|nr:helix-turn-helix domain-containing protein [Saccharopolyspora phatthalungensis]MBB5157172.1 transcriptional regulator with XRE-family HTH domain [Saccharopolyspora phatthalungensis]
MVDEAELGAGLRQARTSKGLSLRSVASAVGISASLLSQVENGKTQPSVSTLYALVTHLGISLDGLLRNPSSAPVEATRSPQPVQRHEDSPRIEMTNGVTWERLAVAGYTFVDPLLTTYAPGGSSSANGKLMRHSGIEYGYLIRGELTLKLDFDTYVLRPGDSLCFESQRPHLYLNHTDSIAQGLWFVVGRAELASGDADRDLPEGSPLTSAADALELLGRRSRQS